MANPSAEIPAPASRASAALATSDDATRGTLQARLALVFTVLAGVSLFYVVSHFTAILLTGSRTTTSIVPILTLVIGLLNGALAVRCRTGRRSSTELHALDAGMTALTCWMMAFLLSQVRPASEASVSFQLGVTYVLLARAVLVPGSGQRTLAVCLFALLPGGALMTSTRVNALELGVPTASDWWSQGHVVFRNLGVTTFLATLTSHVIYGLRRQIRENARVGQYLLKEKLGEGGMGVVYRATHALLRRETAIKLLLPNRIGAESVARFAREVKLTAQLTHPNTVAIYDYGRTPEGVFYYAMEHLDGGDLEQLVAYAGPLEPGRAVRIVEQICRALSEAHALGLIHRDIKPSNVLLCERGGEGDVAKLLDFGLVKDLNEPEAARLTQGGALTGTPLYLAPEAITSPDAMDARSDLYSLGALAYFLLIGKPVFMAKTVTEVCMAHLQTAPAPLCDQRAEISAELEAVILRSLEKDPAARFQSAAALREALLNCAEAESWTTERASDWWQTHREPFRSYRESQRRSGSDARSGSATLEAAAVRVDFESRR
jgi:serine/threonine-protein kinase